MEDIFGSIIERQRRNAELHQLYDTLERLRRMLESKKDEIRARRRESEDSSDIYNQIKRRIDEAVQEVEQNYYEMEHYEVDDNMIGFWEDYMNGLRTIMKGHELENALEPFNELLNRLSASISKNEELVSTLNGEINRIEQEIAETQRAINNLEG